MNIVIRPEGLGEVCEAEWFDANPSGPQENFRFLRMTLIGDSYIGIEGRYTTSGPVVPNLFPFAIYGRGTNLSGTTFIPEPNMWA